MPDGVKVTFRNKDRLFAKLKALAPETEKALVASNGKAAEEMVSLARSFAPVKSGALRDSIVATPPGGTPPGHSQGGGPVPPGAWAVTAGNDRVRYAALVEWGTQPHANAGEFAGTENPGTTARGFFFPAFRLVRKSMRSRATRAINAAVKKVVGK